MSSPDLLLHGAWDNVVPGFRQRRAEKHYAPYTCLIHGGGARMVREVVYQGRSTDEIPIEVSVQNMETGEVGPGWSMKCGLAEYVGYLWMGDRQFEALPWPPFLSWWMGVIREGPRWKREFGVMVLEKDGLKHTTAMIPLAVARRACNVQMSLNLVEGRSGSGLEVLRENWRTWED